MAFIRMMPYLNPKLGCQAKAKTDLIVALRTPLSQLRRAAPPVFASRILRIETVAKETVHLVLQLDQALDFLPGQYAKVKIPGTQEWRAYSFTNLPNQDQLVCLFGCCHRAV